MPDCVTLSRIMSVRAGQARSGQDREGQDRSRQVRSGHVRSGQAISPKPGKVTLGAGLGRVGGALLGASSDTCDLCRVTAAAAAPLRSLSPTDRQPVSPCVTDTLTLCHDIADTVSRQDTAQLALTPPAHSGSIWC